MSRNVTDRRHAVQDGYQRVNRALMRSKLVLTDETAHHPFLMSLPPHVRSGAERSDMQPKWRLNTQDVKEFLMAYCACFMAASIFLA